MKVSIVTVSFNAQDTIAETIRSVREQRYPDLEHIIVDGASTDGTLRVIESHAGPGAIVISEPDRGLYDAMNKGIDRASGDVIGILNADDFLAGPGTIADIVDTFAGTPGIDAVLGDIEFLPDRYGLVRRYDSGGFKPELLGWGRMPAHPGMYLARDAYERVGRYRLDYRIAADFEFMVRAFGSAGIRYAYVPEVFVKMRPGGISTAGLKSKLLINREMIRACRDNGVSTSWPRMLSKYLYKVLEYRRRP